MSLLFQVCAVVSMTIKDELNSPMLIGNVVRDWLEAGREHVFNYQDRAIIVFLGKFCIQNFEEDWLECEIPCCFLHTVENWKNQQ